MAHGRKRSFFAGCLLGALLVTGLLGIVIYGSGLRLGPSGYPYFTAEKANANVLEWARLSPWPAEAQNFSIKNSGTLFTCEFRVSFSGDPAAIEAWVKSCPGIADPDGTHDTASDGTVTYTIPPGGEAMYAELVHNPQRGTVNIFTHWN